MSSERFQPARKTRSFLDPAAKTLLLVASLAACTAEIEADRPQRLERGTGRTIQPVIAGSPSGHVHDAVVAMGRFDEAGARRGLCTATLVAPNLVLTARHCVSAVEGGAGCGPDGTAVVGAALTGDTPATDIGVFTAEGGVAPDTESIDSASARGKLLVVDPEASTICDRDIALVVLDRDLPGPIAKIRFGAPRADEALSVVGFGVTEDGFLSDVRRVRGDVTWLGVGPRLYPESDRYGLGPAEVMIGESVCAGDSGGPLLAPSGAVVGVASRVGNGQPRDPNNLASTCVGEASHAVYSQIGAHEALVRRGFEAAGRRPWIEGEKHPDASRLAREDVPRVLEGPPLVADAADRDTKSAAMDARDEVAEGGCSTTPSSPRDAVAEALGVTAVLLLLFRAGRRAREDEAERAEREEV